MSDHFEKVSPKRRIGDALNVLAEAPFFFQRDDPELFAFLRRHRAAFARFYEDHFGWQLVVEGPMARLYKSRWVNKALTPSQHDVFDLTRRDECLGFLLVLEFHEHLLDERNASIDDTEPLRFEMGELLSFVGGRLTEELGEEEGGEDAARRILRAIFPTLLRFRFLIDIPPPPETRASLHPDRHLYECTPALHQYDVRLLADAALGRALRQEDGPEASLAGEDTDGSEDAEVEP
jgi:hypothetical protein